MRYKLGRRRANILKLFLSKKMVITYTAAAVILSIFAYNKLLTEQITEPVIFEATTMTTDLINSAVNDYLTENSDFSTKCITTLSENGGSAYSYSVNSDLINDAKEQITKKLISALDKNSVIKIQIPVGSLISSQYFSGKGFPVGAKVYSKYKINCETHSNFESVGINQSLYKVSMTVNVELDLIFPKGHNTVPVSCDITLAEKIIIGGVPLA